MVDIQLQLINGSVVNGSGLLAGESKIVTAAHVLSTLVDRRVEGVVVRTLFGELPSIELAPGDVSFARLGDPDPDRNGQADFSEIGIDLGVVQLPLLNLTVPKLTRHALLEFLPTTRFALDGFAPRPGFEVASGLVQPASNELWEFTEPLESKPGDSGSAILSTSINGFQPIGITSTTDFAVALKDDQWEWIDLISNPENPAKPVESHPGKHFDDYFFRQTTGNDVLIRHEEAGNYHGGRGFDRAFIDGAIDQILMDGPTGAFQIQFQSGEQLELMDFEVVLTPTHRFYSSNDAVYTHLFRALTVLEGYDTAKHWSPLARNWFDDLSIKSEVVDLVLDLLRYADVEPDQTPQVVNTVLKNLGLDNLPANQIAEIYTWASEQSIADLTLMGVEFLEFSVELNVVYGHEIFMS